MTEFRITKTGEYRTRDGKKAIVLCLDAPDKYQPVVGYIIDDMKREICESQTWSLNGFTGYKESANIVSELKLLKNTIVLNRITK